MLNFNERITNIEALLSLISININNAATDGTIDTTNDELGAVIDELFDSLNNLKERYFTVDKQLTMVSDILNQATRK